MIEIIKSTGEFKEIVTMAWAFIVIGIWIKTDYTRHRFIIRAVSLLVLIPVFLLYLWILS